MSNLDTVKLGKLLALAGSDQDGEAVTALRKANAMLKSAGMSFTDVAEKLKAPKAPIVQNGRQSNQDQGATWNSAFTGFDDWVEAREPGWKARRSAERNKRNRDQAEERISVIAKYGSEDAATAPCERERVLDDACAHLVRRVIKTDSRGKLSMDTLDGWAGGVDDPPASVIEAVSSALPMPTTIREAQEECVYWETRNREIDAIHGFTGDRQLGLAAEVRWGLVRGLYERGLPILDLDDIHARLQFVASSEFNCDAADAAPALLEAFERLVINAGLATVSAPTVQSGRLSRASDRRSRIIDMLSNSDTAKLSDREIARQVGVSPSTVGALRRRMTAAPLS